MKEYANNSLFVLLTFLSWLQVSNAHYIFCFFDLAPAGRKQHKKGVFKSCECLLLRPIPVTRNSLITTH